ncbi:MAG: FixH family protein [Polyangiaceae bacterium]|nr:FixH family protein [Myxococcales bacterium]MCB9590556.1 FixH family protein [Polyangiaceae bacterium]MCB9608551.1 FixH family protein [Polyangiaceae bacterium]
MAPSISGALTRHPGRQRFSRSLRLLVPLATSALLLGACSSDSDDPSGSGGTGNSEFSCKHATDTYSVGLSKMSSKAMFEVMLMDADPAPPAKLANTWMVHVKDASGNNVSGATLSVNPNMPDHGHGSTQTTVVTDMGDGMYQLTPVYMQMAGYWAVPITVTMGADTDTAQFDFCIAP